MSKVLGDLGQSRRADGERRHVTMMFCDIVESTKLASLLDPEDWRELVAQFNEVVAGAAKSFGGNIAQVRGDSALVAFGWPLALEQPVHAALLAALETLRNLQTEDARSEPTRQIRVRIGVHFGKVVVDAAGEIYGDAANVAARIESAAAAGTILVSESVRRAVGRDFVFEDAGVQHLKGIAQPLRLHKLLRPALRSPLMEEAIHCVSPMLGRDGELQILTAAFAAATSGSAQSLLLAGEPGVGKSRLLREFKMAIADDGALWLGFSGSPFRSSAPFGAVADGIAANLAALGHARQRPAIAIQTALRMAGIEFRPNTDRFSSLLLRLGDLARGGAHAFAQDHDVLVAGLANVVTGLSRKRPVVLIFDDAQWLDPATCEVLRRIQSEYAGHRILMVLASRPVRQSGAGEMPFAQSIQLAALSETHIRAIVSARSKGDGLAPEVVDKIVFRSNGFPLYAEELADASSCDGMGAHQGDVPLSLSAALQARLDRMGAAKSIAHAAAVIGVESWIGLIAEVLGVDALAAEDGVSRLVDAGIMEYAPGGAAAVRFRHALFQEVTYENILRANRKSAHERIAKLTEGKNTGGYATTAAFVARHWHGAGNLKAAVRYWREAAESAGELGSFQVSESICEEALAALLTYPPSDERDRLETGLRRRLAGLVQITAGYSSQRAIAKGEALRIHIGRTAAAGETSSLLRQWAALSSGGQYVRSRQVALEILDASIRSKDADRMAEAHMAMMTTTFRLGELDEAGRWFETGRQYFEQSSFRTMRGAIAQTYGNASQIAWLTGNHKGALERIQFADAVVRETKNAFDTAFVKHMEATLEALLGRFSRARAAADVALDLSSKHAFPQFEAISRVVRGFSLTGAGEASRGLAEILDGFAAMDRNGIRVARPLYLAWLGETYADLGSFQQSAAAFQDALSYNSEERFFAADILRRKARVEAAFGDLARACATYRDAARAAKGMGAHYVEYSCLRQLRRLSPDGQTVEDATRADDLREPMTLLPSNEE